MAHGLHADLSDIGRDLGFYAGGELRRGYTEETDKRLAVFYTQKYVWVEGS